LIGQVLGPSFYSIYSSGVTVKYLIQISTGVSGYLWLLNVRTSPYNYYLDVTHCWKWIVLVHRDFSRSLVLLVHCDQSMQINDVI